jgi:hypothetical protein
MLTKVDSGDLDVMVFLSFRYALSRSSSIVEDVADLVKKYMTVLDKNTLRQICSEIEHEAELLKAVDRMTWMALVDNIDKYLTNI